MTKITSGGEIIVYQSKDGGLEIKTKIHKDTVWLTQSQISVLFSVQRPAITKHLANIFLAGELEKNSVCSILEHTAADGKKYKTTHYNLDAVISVGFESTQKKPHNSVSGRLRHSKTIY